MNHEQILSSAYAIHAKIMEEFPEHAAVLRSVKYRVSHRMTNGLGACRYRNRVPFEIVLSFAAFKHEENRNEFTDTVLHEIAHAIAGKLGDHGPAWKAVARKLGARPEACSGRLTVSPVQLVSVPCAVCGEAVPCSPRQAAKARKGTMRYRHTHCKPVQTPLDLINQIFS